MTYICCQTWDNGGVFRVEERGEIDAQERQTLEDMRVQFDLRPKTQVYNSYKAFQKALLDQDRSVTIGRFIAFHVDWDANVSERDRQDFWVGKVTDIDDAEVIVHYYHTGKHSTKDYSCAVFKPWTGRNKAVKVGMTAVTHPSKKIEGIREAVRVGIRESPNPGLRPVLAKSQSLPTRAAERGAALLATRENVEGARGVTRALMGRGNSRREESLLATKNKSQHRDGDGPNGHLVRVLNTDSFSLASSSSARHICWAPLAVISQRGSHNSVSLIEVVGESSFASPSAPISPTLLYPSTSLDSFGWS